MIPKFPEGQWGSKFFHRFFFSSVHPKSPDNFANRTSVFIVLLLWNVGSTTFPPLRTISEKNPAIPITRSGFASVALSRMGLFLHCRGRLGLQSSSRFFFFGGGEADLKTNRDELLRNHQLIVGCSQIVYFRGFISPQPRLQGQVLSTWGEVIATATWTPDSRFESLVDE